MKKSSTKGALFTSALALLLCFVMLLGTTFAWFTDEVTSANNKIQAGNLSIDLLVKDASGDYVSVKESKAAIFDYSNWEPGYTEVRNVKVENLGSLSLKYMLSIVVAKDATAVEDLAKVIDVYYADSEVAVADRSLAGLTRVGTLADVIAQQNGTLMVNDYLYAKDDPKNLNNQHVDFATIALKMQESAGNEYQGAKVGAQFDLRLYATQLDHEIDSFGPDYDEGLVPTTSYVATEAELTEALAEGGKIELMGDITLENTLTIAEDAEVVLDMGTYKLDSENTVITNNGTLTIIGGTLETTKVNGTATISNNGNLVLDGAEVIGAPIGATGNPSYTISNAGNLTVEEGTAVSADRGCLFLSGTGETTINGGTFTNNDIGSRELTSHVVVVGYGANNKLTINDGTFQHLHTQTSGGVVINNWSAVTVDINGGSFSGGNYFGKWDNLSDYGYGSTSTPFSVKGGTFTGFDNKYLAPGYETQSLGGSAVVVLPAGDDTVAGADNSTTLNTAIAGGATTVYLGSGNYIIPDSAQGKTLTFVGNGDTVIATQDDGSYEGCDYSLDGATVTFEGITITTDSTTYTGYARLKATYNNCTINGTYTLYDDSEFNNCTFNVEGDVYNIWTWGAAKATFNDCTFNTSGKAILLYGGANTVLKATNCTFNDDDAYADVNNKAAIEAGTDWATDTKEIIATNCTVNGFDVTTKGINTGSTLWGNKNSMPSTRLNVVIDGVDVY